MCVCARAPVVCDKKEQIIFCIACVLQVCVCVCVCVHARACVCVYISWISTVAN